MSRIGYLSWRWCELFLAGIVETAASPRMRRSFAPVNGRRIKEMPNQRISIVIPVLNEERSISPLLGALRQVLETTDIDWSILFVDDGSTDRTFEKIREGWSHDHRIQGVSLSRNFGKEQAIAAGLHLARGDCVLIMDADLQHPPRYIPEFLKAWRSGAKVVFGQRVNRDSDGFMRRKCSDLFYTLFHLLGGGRLPRGTVDFVLLDRSAVDALNQLKERARFTKGLFSWIGFHATTLPFHADARVVGKSQYHFLKLLHLALDGIISFTTLPLRVWTVIGGFISLSALIYSGYFLIKTLIFQPDVPGFPSLIVSIMFFSGVQLFSLGVIGEYIGRIFDEVKRRPIYIISEEVGLAQPIVNNKDDV